MAPGSRDSGTWRTDTHTTSAARGRLMRKMSRQEAAWTSQPPRNGPIAAVTPPSPDQAPMAGPRSSRRKLASMMARLPGVSRAPPMPWRARAAIRASSVGARPHSSEATANQITPITNTLRRP